MDRQGEPGVRHGPQQAGKFLRHRGLRDPRGRAQVQLERAGPSSEAGDPRPRAGHGVYQDIHRRAPWDPAQLIVHAVRRVDRGLGVRHLSDQPDPPQGGPERRGPEVLDPFGPRLPGVDVQVHRRREEYRLPEVAAGTARDVASDLDDEPVLVDPDIDRL